MWLILSISAAPKGPPSIMQIFSRSSSLRIAISPIITLSPCTSSSWGLAGRLGIAEGCWVVRLLKSPSRPTAT